MNIKLSTNVPKSDVLFLLMHEKSDLSAEVKKHLDKSLLKSIESRIADKDFEGKWGQSLILFPEGSTTKKVVLMGLGKKDKAEIDKAETVGARCATSANSLKAKHITVAIEDLDMKDFLHGLVLGAYDFVAYKSKDPEAINLEDVTILTKPTKSAEELLKYAENYMHASSLLRNLMNASAVEVTTLTLAQEAKKLEKYGMKVTIIDKKQLEKLGCGLILGVGRGAEHPPLMAIIEYKHKSKDKEPSVAFVGKGITFDTGGLNLKPSGYIETMKLDMAGAATVLSLFHMIGMSKIPGHFIGVMSCAENAISHLAMHPGDVLRAYNGKTVEVNNTDAEGRLVLGDALSYTEEKYKPKKMVDVATLTGSVIHALGYFITGVMGNNQKFVDEVMGAARASGERVWQLPMDDDFVQAAKGTFTDLQNSTNGIKAGTIMGAAFLAHFVKKAEWVHIDFAGTAWVEKPSATTKYGSSAAMLRTLFELAKQNSN